MLNRCFDVSIVAWRGGGVVLTGLSNLSIAMVEELYELGGRNQYQHVMERKSMSYLF
jgi:hypothetical protein